MPQIHFGCDIFDSKVKIGNVKKAKYRGYMQTENDTELYKSCFLPQKNKNAPMVLVYLYKASAGKKGVKVSHPKISKDLGISQRTVAKCIEILVDDMAILRYTRSDGNVYVVNSALYWEGDRCLKENSAFNFGGIVNNHYKTDIGLTEYYEKETIIIPLKQIEDHEINIIKDIK